MHMHNYQLSIKYVSMHMHAIGTVLILWGEIGTTCVTLLLAIYVIWFDSQKVAVGKSGERDEVLAKEAELGEDGKEAWLEVLIRERGEELNIDLSVQGWGVGSLDAGLKITDVVSSLCSADGEAASALPWTSALCSNRWNPHINTTSFHCM